MEFLGLASKEVKAKLVANSWAPTVLQDRAVTTKRVSTDPRFWRRGAEKPASENPPKGGGRVDSPFASTLRRIQQRVEVVDRTEDRTTG